jgi:hypothetical protein
MNLEMETEATKKKPAGRSLLSTPATAVEPPQFESRQKLESIMGDVTWLRQFLTTKSSVQKTKPAKKG